MKQLLTLPIILLFISCDGNKVSQEELDRDLAFKDSIALADGNKAIGNILFGITEKEFDRMSSNFMLDNKFSLMGEDIQTIDGFFTDSDELCRITLPSGRKADETNVHSYENFLKQKYGLPTSKNIWVVGDRRFTLSVESRFVDISYAIRKSYQAKMRGIDEHPISKDFHSHKNFRFYVLHIQNDSLYKVYCNQQAESKRLEEAQKAQDRKEQQKLQEEKKEELFRKL